MTRERIGQEFIPDQIAAVTDKPIVEARFHLVEVSAVQAWGETGYQTTKMVKVTLNAAKSGIFGKASPGGQLWITIANPDAARVFEQAFEDAAVGFYDSERPAPKMGTKRFRVYIIEDEDQAPA